MISNISLKGVSSGDNVGIRVDKHLDFLDPERERERELEEDLELEPE